MSEITLNELNKRLEWNLLQKIDHSLYVIDSFLAEYPNCVIAFSGGVDSVVMLHLVRMIDKNRKAVFSNTTNEFREIIKFIKQTNNVDIINPKMSFSQVVTQYGFPLISKKVAKMAHTLRHPTNDNERVRKLYLTGISPITGKKHKLFMYPKKYEFLLHTQFEITHRCCDILKKNPMASIAKNGIFIGTKAVDSVERKFNYLKTGCINNLGKKCTPLSIWTKKDIWEYLKKYNVPYCDVYDKGEESTGCAYCGFGIQFDSTRFSRLKQREPKRFEVMMGLKNNNVTYREALSHIIDINISNFQASFFDDVH